MKTAHVLFALAAAGLTVPALAAPAAPAAAPAAPTAAAAANVDDFGCMLRTVFMANAAQDSATKATDPTQKQQAAGAAEQAFDAHSFFTGKLSAKGPLPTKARFDAEVAKIKATEQQALIGQVSACIARATAERTAYLKPIMT